MAGLSPFNRALNLIPKRAESSQAEHLRDTFEDSGVSAALEAVDHQILYGRRGTGKTHALRYVEVMVQERGDVAVYVDLRTVGSPGALFMSADLATTDRAARLLIDILNQLHDAILAAALDDTELVADGAFVKKLDQLLTSITTVRVEGEVELSHEEEKKASQRDKAGISAKLGPSPELQLGLSDHRGTEDRSRYSEVRRGTERGYLNFSEVARALRELAEVLTSKRIWVLLDEWINVPLDVQPFLAEFLVRCVFPLQMFTVKVGAIEQQTAFRSTLPDGTTIGIELGADVAANLDLDDFMVFEQSQERARSFFLGLFYKHLSSSVADEDRIQDLVSEQSVVSLGFTDTRAFDELVRAAEGVPRDALNIAAKAALRAGDNRISVADVRAAARSWFETDKEGALNSNEDARGLLNWIRDEVIRGKRARGFMVNQRSAGSPLLATLFNARVIHLVRRGYSAQDEPGERYDVYVIDYGAYVDLIHTKYEPEGMLPLDIYTDEGYADGGYVDVPTQDLRALRRAILDLNKLQRGERKGRRG